jgi:hypothetical protein
VALAYGVAIVTRTSQAMSLTFDEVVYASHLSRLVPAAQFTAPRAEGMPLLMAPVTNVTTDPRALRVYLVLLSMAGLFLAFVPWVAVLLRAGRTAAYVPAVAAGCFVTLWPVLLYGTMGYPNLLPEPPGAGTLRRWSEPASRSPRRPYYAPPMRWRRPGPCWSCRSCCVPGPHGARYWPPRPQ